MPNTKSATQRVRLTRNRTEINQRNRSRARSSQKNFLNVVEGGNKDDAKKALNHAYSAIDKALKKGVYTRAKASRIKSRLASKLATLS